MMGAGRKDRRFLLFRIGRFFLSGFHATIRFGSCVKLSSHATHRSAFCDLSDRTSFQSPSCPFHPLTGRGVEEAGDEALTAISALMWVIDAGSLIRFQRFAKTMLEGESHERTD